MATRGSILVVDDEEGILKSIRRQLQGEPYELHLAASGAEGLEVLQRVCVNLIISDMRMPGMDGVTFLRKAAESCPHSVRMVLSGYAEVGSILDAVNRGHIWRYITKPWQPEDLKLAIRNGLDLWESEAERRRLLEQVKAKNRELEAMNTVLEEKVRARTWELQERSDILHLILEDAPIDTVLGRSLVAVQKICGAERAALTIAFENRTLGADSGMIPAGALQLVEECRSRGQPASGEGIQAFPLAKGGDYLGTLLLIRPSGEPQGRTAAVDSMASLMTMALVFHKTMVEAPNLLGNIDKLLEGIR